MLMSPVGLRSEKGSAGDAWQKLKSTDPTSCHTSTNPKMQKKKKKKENGKNWLRVPGGCLTPRRTGRQTVGRNITLTLTNIDNV
jgi:hypothetical protein